MNYFQSKRSPKGDPRKPEKKEIREEFELEFINQLQASDQYQQILDNKKGKEWLYPPNYNISDSNKKKLSQVESLNDNTQQSRESITCLIQEIDGVAKGQFKNNETNQQQLDLTRLFDFGGYKYNQQLDKTFEGGSNKQIVQILGDDQKESSQVSEENEADFNNKDSDTQTRIPVNYQRNGSLLIDRKGDQRQSLPSLPQSPLIRMKTDQETGSKPLLRPTIPPKHLQSQGNYDSIGDLGRINTLISSKVNHTGEKSQEHQKTSRSGNKIWLQQQNFLSRHYPSSHYQSILKLQSLRNLAESNFSIEAYEEHLNNQFAESNMKLLQKPRKETSNASGVFGGVLNRGSNAPSNQNSPILLERKNLQKSNKMKRMPGIQEIPKVLKEQTNKHLRNKQILSKFVPMFNDKNEIQQKNRRQSDVSLFQLSHFNISSKDPDSPVPNSPGSNYSQNKFVKNGSIKESSIMSIGDDSPAKIESDYDTDILEENINNDRENSLKKDKFVLEPDSYTRSAWDITIFVCIVYQAISLPFKISYEVGSPIEIFRLEIFMDVLFMLDVPLNFNTGYYSKRSLIMQRRQIAIDYLKYWFWIDLFSSIPYTWILAITEGLSLLEVEQDDTTQLATNTPQLLRLLKIAKFIKILKLLRVMKLKRLLIKFEDYIVTDSMDLLVTFINLAVIIIVLAHYLSCMMYYVGLDEFRSTGESWLVTQNILDKDLITRYITCMYWATTTMIGIGYGDIAPTTINEKLWTMGMLVSSCGIFAFVVNRLSSIVSSYNQIQGQYREKMMYVNKFMIKQGMPHDLRMKVRRYLDYVFESKKDIKVEEADVLQLLNEGLRDKILIQLKGKVLKQINFLSEFGLDFASELSQYFQTQTFVAEDFIFVEKDKAESIFYINSGKVAMVHKQTHSFLTDLGIDQYFGEIGLLTGQQRTLSAKSIDFSEVLILSKKDFEEVSENYIDAMKAIRRIKEGLEAGDYTLVKTQCYICKSHKHLALKCPDFPKWRGNLMMIYMFLNQLKDMSKSSMDRQHKNSKSNIHGYKKVMQGLEQIDEVQKAQLKKMQYMAYVEGDHDNKHYQSLESEEEFEVKKQLLRKHLPDFQEVINGPLIHLILSQPKQALIIDQHELYLKEKERLQSLRQAVRERRERSKAVHSPFAKSSEKSQSIIESQRKEKRRMGILIQKQSQESGSLYQQTVLNDYRLTNIIEEEKENVSEVDKQCSSDNRPDHEQLSSNDFKTLSRFNLCYFPLPSLFIQSNSNTQTLIALIAGSRVLASLINRSTLYQRILRAGGQVIEIRIWKKTNNFRLGRFATRFVCCIPSWSNRNYVIQSQWVQDTNESSTKMLKYSKSLEPNFDILDNQLPPQSVYVPSQSQASNYNSMFGMFLTSFNQPSLPLERVPGRLISVEKKESLKKEDESEEQKIEAIQPLRISLQKSAPKITSPFFIETEDLRMPKNQITKRSPSKQKQTGKSDFRKNKFDKIYNQSNPNTNLQKKKVNEQQEGRGSKLNRFKKREKTYNNNNLKDQIQVYNQLSGSKIAHIYSISKAAQKQIGLLETQQQTRQDSNSRLHSKTNKSIKNNKRPRSYHSKKQGKLYDTYSDKKAKESSPREKSQSDKGKAFYEVSLKNSLKETSNMERPSSNEFPRIHIVSNQLRQINQDYRPNRFKTIQESAHQQELTLNQSETQQNRVAEQSGGREEQKQGSFKEIKRDKWAKK